jgi:hypothetical protein
MKNKFSIASFSTLMVFFLFFLSSCEIIGGIFKAGVWVGILVVVGVIALIIWLFSRLGGRK